MRNMRRHRKDPFVLARHIAPARQLVPALALVAAAENIRRLGAGIDDRLAVLDRVDQRVNVIDADAGIARLPALAEIGAEEHRAAMDAGVDAAVHRLHHHRADMLAFEQRAAMAPILTRRALQDSDAFRRADQQPRCGGGTAINIHAVGCETGCRHGRLLLMQSIFAGARAKRMRAYYLRVTR